MKTLNKSLCVKRLAWGTVDTYLMIVTRSVEGFTESQGRGHLNCLAQPQKIQQYLMYSGSRKPSIFEKGFKTGHFQAIWEEISKQQESLPKRMKNKLKRRENSGRIYIRRFQQFWFQMWNKISISPFIFWWANVIFFPIFLVSFYTFGNLFQS